MFDALPPQPPAAMVQAAPAARVAYDVGVYRVESAKFAAPSVSLAQRALGEAFREDELRGLSQTITNGNGCDAFAGTNCFAKIEESHFRNFGNRMQREQNDGAVRPVYHPVVEKDFFRVQVKAGMSRAVYRSAVGTLANHPGFRALVEGRYESGFSFAGEGSSAASSATPSGYQKPVYVAKNVPGRGLVLVETFVATAPSAAVFPAGVAQREGQTTADVVKNFMGVSTTPLTSYRTRFERTAPGPIYKGFNLSQVRWTVEENAQIVVADLSGLLQGSPEKIQWNLKLPVRRHSLAVSFAPITYKATYTYAFKLTPERDVSLSYDESARVYTARYELGPARDKALVLQANRLNKQVTAGIVKEI